MNHYYIELLLWLAAVYFIGCLIGAFARKLFAQAPAIVDHTDMQQSEVQLAAVTAAPLAAAAIETADPAPGHAPMAPRWSSPSEPAETIASGLVEDDDQVAEEEEASVAAPAPVRARMPVGISAPRGTGPDELQRISGVGPKNEQILHSLGFYHFDQISQWTDEQVEWVDGYLRFNGRIRRENWVEQCRLLAAGDEAEFSRLYGTGGMVSADGVTRSGEKTRR